MLTARANFINGLIATAIAFATTGCATTSDTTSKNAPGHVTAPSTRTVAEVPTFSEVLSLTSAHEKMLDDGWWFSQYPRIFKSPYAGATPKLKAKFALDYAGFLDTKNQDLVANWDSYVPYTQRAKFAENWWQQNDDSGRFATQSPKMNIIWVHEALLDASELWWRAFEEKNINCMPAAQALAHEEEQKKVFNYMDREGQIRSLHELLAETKHKSQN